MSACGDSQVRRVNGRLALSERVRHPQDLCLAQRATRLDEAAWREIYDQTHGRIFALLSYQTGDREEARELLQETYVCALRGIHRYHGEGSLLAWLAVIAIRRARDWKRRLCLGRRRRRRLRQYGPTSPSHDDPEQRRALISALQRLDGRQRAVFLLRVLHGHSFEEIAHALGCCAATARVHHFRARQKLQAALGGARRPEAGAGADSQATAHRVASPPRPEEEAS